MIKLTPAKCPNCGASIKVDTELRETVCQYCRTTILIEGAINAFKSKRNCRDVIDEKCSQISSKLNLILKLYKGNKNEMLLMLKNKIGLVSSGRTTAKIAMMQTAHNYKEETLEKAFTYEIENRTLNHFEYKRDGSIELTYESDEGLFALEYYGRITKYTDLGELSRVLDEIIERIR